MDQTFVADRLHKVLDERPRQTAQSFKSQRRVLCEPITLKVSNRETRERAR